MPNDASYTVRNDMYTYFEGVNWVKAGFHLKAVFTSLNVAFVPVSRSRFKQRQIPPLRTFTNVLRFCVNFLMMFGHSVNEIFFSKDRLN